MKQPSRWRIAQSCLHLLEEVYLLDRFPPQTTRNELATSLNVSARQIQVWFQNRRQRDRKLESKAQESAAKVAMPPPTVTDLWKTAPLQPNEDRMMRDESCETLLLDAEHLGELTWGDEARGGASDWGMGGLAGAGSAAAPSKSADSLQSLGLRPLTAEPRGLPLLPARSALDLGAGSQEIRGAYPASTAASPVAPHRTSPPGAAAAVAAAAAAAAAAARPLPPASTPLSLLGLPPLAPGSAGHSVERILKPYIGRPTLDAVGEVGTAWPTLCYTTLEAHCRAAVAAAKGALAQPPQSPPGPDGASGAQSTSAPTPVDLGGHLGGKVAVDYGGFPMLHMMVAGAIASHRMPHRLPMPLGMHAAPAAEAAPSEREQRERELRGRHGGGHGHTMQMQMQMQMHGGFGCTERELERGIADELAAIDFGAMPELGLLDCMGLQHDMAHDMASPRPRPTLAPCPTPNPQHPLARPCHGHGHGKPGRHRRS